METDKCCLCKSREVQITKDNRFENHSITFRCKICGVVDIDEFLVDDNLKLFEENRYLISGYTRERTFKRQSAVRINENNFEEILSLCPKRVTEKLEKFLMYMGSTSEKFGNHIPIDPDRDYTLSYAKDKNDFSFHLQYLKEKNLIDNYPEGKYLTFDGWQRYEELLNTRKSVNHVFVAMWFGSPNRVDELQNVYLRAIKRAIEDAGIDPKLKSVRIDFVEHNDPIDDKILAEIKKSKFVVADFTGHRGGVYFETGYALGLGIPVIWTCKKDDASKMHFDTRQFNRIEWEDENDLYKRLKNRIEGSIF